MFHTLRTALRSKEPLDFLAVISGFVAVTDPRARDASSPNADFHAAGLGQGGQLTNEGRAGLSELVDSFVGTPYAETTAALTVIKALTADEVLAALIGAAG